MANIKHKKEELNEDSDDSSSDYTPSPRPSRRQITQSVRRHSRLLYLEKYGLNQPGWYSSDNLNEYENDSSEEELCEEIEEQRKKIEEYKAQMVKPPSPVIEDQDIQPIGQVTLKRPVSIRNYVQNTTTQKRPAKFVKPLNSANSIGKVALPSTEFTQVHKLLEVYEKKIYIEGYLQKKNDLKSNGSSCNVKSWSVWYVELCGPVLSLWDASESKEDIFPQYINITDSHIEQDSSLNSFSLNSAGANRYILQALNSEALHRWITAIRLSCFECSRIQEIYTKAFISRPLYAKYIAVPKKPRPGLTGFLHARFPNATGWKQYWVVVTNQKKQKSLFGKKIVPTTGRIMFYESKKAKHPVMTVQHVVQAYTVYPESPKLINTATLFKIEGSLYKNGLKDSELISPVSSTLLMSSTTNDMVDWLIHIFDSFQLYGLPGSLLNDPHNRKALNFGEQDDSLKQKLFLDLEEISNHSLRNKADFTELLAQKWMVNHSGDDDDDSILSTPKSQQRPHPIQISENRLRSTKSSDDESMHIQKTHHTHSSLKSPIHSPRTPVVSPLWPSNHSTTSVCDRIMTEADSRTWCTPYFCSTDTLQRQMSPTSYRAEHIPDEIKEDESETPISPAFPTRLSTQFAIKDTYVMNEKTKEDQISPTEIFYESKENSFHEKVTPKSESWQTHLSKFFDH